MRKKVLFIALVIGFVLLSDLCSSWIWANSQPGGDESRIIHSQKSLEKPQIDGVLDDEIWQSPPIEKDFISYNPLYGEVLPYKTLIWMAHDGKNLYFAFQCYDLEPEKIKTSITKRDNMFYDDWVAFFLDAIGNKQSVYGFFVNPNGIQGDSLFSAVSGEDTSVDFIWESAGHVNDRGYQVEVKIPLKSLSYKSGKEVKMGLFVFRKICRLGIYGSWPESSPGQGLFNSLAPITYKNIENALKLEILPSVIYGSNHTRINPQEWGGRDIFKEFGIGLKYGITSSLTLDTTINPDFSQVESDAFQVEVNQRYPLFYSEKRPFFMEGTDIFSFFTLPYGFFPNAVHTRRIVDPKWGAKLTGTIGKTTVGVLAAADDWSGQGLETGINPNEKKIAFFGITRGKYSLGKDNYFGILYSGHEFAGNSNHVMGVDVGYRFFKDHKINASFLYSNSGTDNSSTGQPGNSNIYSTNINFQYLYKTKTWLIQSGFEHIGSNFRMQSAYLMRTGIKQGITKIKYNFNPDLKKLSWLKQISPEIEYQYIYDVNTQLDDSCLKLSLNSNFIKAGYLSFNYFAVKENWKGLAFDLNQFKLVGWIQLTKWLRIGGELKQGDKIYYEAEPSFMGNGYDGSFFMEFQPNDNINQYFSFFHSDLSKDKQRIYDVNIFYSKTTYQFNKYLFLRAILQYNSFRKRLLTDFLASFTLIPGTVLHIGYGGLYEGREWQDGSWVYRQGELVNMKRSLFLKASYLWRF